MKYVVIVLLTILLLCTGCTEKTNGDNGIGDSIGCSAVEVTSKPWVPITPKYFSDDVVLNKWGRDTRASGKAVCFWVRPTYEAVAGREYNTILYEKGVKRHTREISWNASEINVKKEREVCFPISDDEYDAYKLEDVTHIFSIKVLCD